MHSTFELLPRFSEIWATSIHLLPSLLSGLLNSKHSLKHFEMFAYQNELLGLKLVNGMMDHLIPLSINQGSQIQLTLE